MHQHVLRRDVLHAADRPITCLANDCSPLLVRQLRVRPRLGRALLYVKDGREDVVDSLPQLRALLLPGQLAQQLVEVAQRAVGVPIVVNSYTLARATREGTKQAWMEEVSKLTGP